MNKSTALQATEQVSSTPRRRLTVTQARRLCEKIMCEAENLRSLLLQLRDGEGWLVLGYPTWAMCCEEELGYSKRHANRLIRADEVRVQVGHMCPTTLNDRQAIELARVPEGQHQAVLNLAIEKAGDKPLTASLIRKAASLIRKAAKEVLEGGPAEEDVGGTHTVEYDAMWYARGAIEHLERIPNDDPRRGEAFAKVRLWIDEQEANA